MKKELLELDALQDAMVEYTRLCGVSMTQSERIELTIRKAIDRLQRGDSRMLRSEMFCVVAALLVLAEIVYYGEKL